MTSPSVSDGTHVRGGGLGPCLRAGMVAMYARLTRFKAHLESRSRVEQLTDEALLPVFRAQPGFERLLLLADEAEGRFAGLSLWESREATEAASPAIDRTVKGVLAGIADGKLTPHLYEVHEARPSGRWPG
jgi:hypothetical protein